MATLILPTTELEAVNECLANIGQSPVSSISGEIGVDAELALKLVRSVNRELQVKGWYWNREYNYPLSPNGDGDIIIPSNTLSVDTDGDSSQKDYVARANLLYDRKNRTYTFTEAVRVSITFGLPFGELPESARRYIALRAARIFQERTEGTSDDRDLVMERSAYADLVADNLRVEDNNLLEDNFDTFEIVRRRIY